LLHGQNNFSGSSPYARPARGTEYDNSYAARGQILLILQVHVRRHQHGKPGHFSRLQQLAIFERRPATFVCGGHIMLRQKLTKRRRCSLIEQDLHLRQRKRAPRGVLQDCAHLLESHTGEQLNELIDGYFVFEVLEQRRDRRTCSAEHPGTAVALGILLNRLASRPVNHG
jgi:hypothetical protein